MDSFGVWYKLEEDKKTNNKSKEKDDNNTSDKVVSVSTEADEKEGYNCLNIEACSIAKDIEIIKKRLGINEDISNNTENKSDNLQFEMHINLWSKLRDEDKDKIYLDIGLKIYNYKKIDKLIFLCPIKLDDDDFEDLSYKLSNKLNANLIFNNECDIETKENYVIINNYEKEERLLVYPLDQAVEGVKSIEPILDNKSKIVIKFDKFKEYINERKSDLNPNGITDLNDLENIYIRFRIKSPLLKEHLFCKLEPLNKFLLSGFVGTEIIDFKINNKRNIENRILASAIREKEKMAEFNAIHFLLMEPSCNDVIYTSNDSVVCRNLEENVWNNYLNIKDELSSILVYHWKNISNKRAVSEFSQLVKINYSKTDRKIITKYILGVVFFGAIGSLLASYLENRFKLIYKNKDLIMNNCIYICFTVLAFIVMCGFIKIVKLFRNRNRQE